jgi:hypothetical protein
MSYLVKVLLGYTKYRWPVTIFFVFRIRPFVHDACNWNVSMVILIGFITKRYLQYYLLVTNHIVLIFQVEILYIILYCMWLKMYASNSHWYFCLTKNKSLINPCFYTVYHRIISQGTTYKHFRIYLSILF